MLNNKDPIDVGEIPGITRHIDERYTLDPSLLPVSVCCNLNMGVTHRSDNRT